MYGVVVHAIAVSVVFVTAGRTNHIVENPCALVVRFDGGLHIQHATKHIT